MEAGRELGIFSELTRAIARTRTVEEIYGIALDTLTAALDVRRTAILLFDGDNVMRFAAHRGLSEGYRKAVEGHSPWRPGEPDARPLLIADATTDASLEAFRPVIEAEAIAAMAFIPLSSSGGVIGKFMLYFDAPRQLDHLELQLAGVIASQVAFAVERTRAEALARRSEERLRFALDAASMGTWDWDLVANTVQWSDNLEELHGLQRGAFKGAFETYEREIHPEDRERVFASIRRALADGVPHEVEYRIVGPDGTVRWVEGKGRVEYDAGVPVRMTGVCMMVTRRKEAELARLSAAEEASRLKDEFLATLSHELRTPLNAILGWVQMVQGGALTPERRQHAIEVIARNSKLQAQLIEDILDVSRIITGKLEIERAPVDLPALINGVVQTLSPVATARGVSVRTAIGDLPPVEGDARRLHQVLNNVLSNAIKFTPDGGFVEVRATPQGAAIAIEVQDSGIGIEPEFLPYVFDRFRQADSRTTRKHGGLGLGLAIAQHVLSCHGGDIRAASAGPGQGTTVTIALPANIAEFPVSPSARPLRDQAIAGFGSWRVVVVDDQADSREVVAEMLTGMGARVTQCDSARAALAAIDRSPVDLLIADIAMPEVDGYELIRQVRRSHAALVAVAVSAYARAEDVSAAISAGFDAYCAKPVEAAGLVEAIGAARRGQRDATATARGI